MNYSYEEWLRGYPAPRRTPLEDIRRLRNQAEQLNFKVFNFRDPGNVIARFQDVTDAAQFIAMSSKRDLVIQPC